MFVFLLAKCMVQTDQLKIPTKLDLYAHTTYSIFSCIIQNALT